VFLFDEPLSNLDAALRVTTRNELIRQQQEIGTTTVYVTHDQVEAMTMGHCICIMNQGKVVQMGRPLEVYRRPADTFVARFLGNPPMNLVKGTLAARGATLTVRLPCGDVPLARTSDATLGRYAGGDVLLGIRPEDLYETQAPHAQGMPRLRARVLAVEPLGAETLVVVALDPSSDEMTARLGRETSLRVGDRVDIAVDTAAIHLFDPITTRAIV
jgi:multiple sugar transport system ATP-binding protein